MELWLALAASLVAGMFAWYAVLIWRFFFAIEGSPLPQAASGCVNGNLHSFVDRVGSISTPFRVPVGHLLTFPDNRRARILPYGIRMGEPHGQTP
jgi:hypothetical protein